MLINSYRQLLWRALPCRLDVGGKLFESLRGVRCSRECELGRKQHASNDTRGGLVVPFPVHRGRFVGLTYQVSFCPHQIKPHWLVNTYSCTDPPYICGTRVVSRVDDSIFGASRANQNLYLGPYSTKLRRHALQKSGIGSCIRHFWDRV